MLTAAVRRWLGGQTVATKTGATGLQIVDAQAARYGDFDDVQIVGLIEGEWPDRIRRNVLYPSSLLALLEPLPAIADPGRRQRDTLHGARAAFKDLVFSAATRVRLSTFALENDAVVEPSILLDDLAGFALSTERGVMGPARVSYAEALALEPRRPEILPAEVAAWAAVRLASDERAADRFKGEAGAWRLPRVSVSRLERYLDCPFRFYASEVLRIDEQPEDEDTRTPLERGRFLHELWERFFSEWQQRGHGRIEPERLLEARAVFEEICEQALAQLPATEAVLERSRLLGSAVSPGIAHRVFAMEAERPTRITERLLEYPLQGDFTFRTRQGESRVVTLSAKTDRIDLLADGTLRVIDYKSKKTPDPKQALQLPIYSFIARESLRASTGGAWTIAEALY
ncbi:MAG: PD-(D/E)XK nuclease family protein, partial [Vicinamibacterales bacterium]